jgi:phosphoribosylaminoimidazolecarboxamide formyltransferase / IMP cyclohydrolase
MARALISVTDKTGLDSFCRDLNELGIDIVASGGTAEFIKNLGISVKAVEEITGYPSILDGRVKTLHPLIFGGILGDINKASHIAEMEKFGIEAFDLVVCNFYDFASVLAEEKLDPESGIHKIDVGGPSMLRAAAKNFLSSLPIFDPADYEQLIEQIKTYGSIKAISKDDRLRWSAKAFAYSARYEALIANYFQKIVQTADTALPEYLFIPLQQAELMRYGENPFQKAALYQSDKNQKDQWKIHQGKQLSYNNYIDIQAAKDIVSQFDENASVIIKHTNPCGFSLGKNPTDAYAGAVKTDPVSYFGGIVGFNKTVDLECAQELKKSFLECIIAPDYTEEALESLAKKKNLRILSYKPDNQESLFDIRTLDMGYLIQEKDLMPDDEKDWQTVTDQKPEAKDWSAIRLSWKLVKYVKSNAIVFANDKMLLGVGGGQMSRIDSVKIAIQKAADAGLSLEGSVLASDAFFPFRDGIDIIQKYGVKGLIQPGGSIRDQEVIDACNEHKLFMIFTGKRHFRH